MATGLFRGYCQAEGFDCSQPDFKTTSLTMSRLDDWPTLKAKAANSAKVSKWLATIANANITDERSELRAVCLQSAADVYCLIEESKFPNWILDPHQRSNLEVLRKRALLSYEWLSKDSHAQGLFRYKNI